MAQAHSGALAGEDGVYEAVFKRYGVMRATSMDELTDTLELFATGMRPRTKGVSALLDSGGQRALMVDIAEPLGVAFAEISDEAKARIDAVLEPGLHAENPLDAWGTGNGADEIYAECLLALDADPLGRVLHVSALVADPAVEFDVLVAFPPHGSDRRRLGLGPSRRRICEPNVPPFGVGFVGVQHLSRVQVA